MLDQSCAYAPIIVLVLVFTEIRNWFSTRGSAPVSPPPGDEYTPYCYYYSFVEKEEVGIVEREREADFSLSWLVLVILCLVASVGSLGARV